MIPSVLRKQSFLVFAAIVVGYFLCNGILQILTEPPAGLHFIRQTDSLSFADNYHYGGYGFFEPHTWNLSSTDGRAALEFPILYYFTSLLKHLFGDTATILRSMVWLIALTGFFSAFAFIRRMTGLEWAAIPLTVLPLSSVVVLHYSSLPMVDGAALGCTLTGLNLVHFYESNPRRIYYCSAGIFFIMLGALLKITFAVLPLAWLLGSAISHLSSASEITSFLRNRTNIRQIVLIATALLAVIAWYSYAIGYNIRSGDNYFLTSSRDFFSLSATERSIVGNAIWFRWKQAFYTNEAWFLLLSVLLLTTLYRRDIPSIIRWRLLMSGIGVIVYFSLFFEQFRDHDYYFLPIVPVVVYLIASAPWAALASAKKVLRISAWSAVLTITGSSLAYSTGKWQRRYEQPETKFSDVPYSLVSHRDEIHQMAQSLPVIVIGDHTRNGSLFFLQHRGLTFPDWEAMNNFQELRTSDQAVILTEAVPPEMYEKATRIGASNWWAIAPH